MAYFSNQTTFLRRKPNYAILKQKLSVNFLARVE